MESRELKGNEGKRLPKYIYAWMGEDELGSGEVGIKQAVVPAGYVAIVSIDKAKAQKYKPQLQLQAACYGNKIYLVRYRVDAVEDFTSEGQEL